MDIIHISARMETHILGSSKIEADMATAFADRLMEQHITGSTMKIIVRDTESRSIPTIISMMDNGKTTRDRVKQCTYTLKQE
jgi:hypothetical protein